MRPPDSPSTEYLYANRWRIWGVVMVGLFMALIDVTIVNISIPQLQRDLGASVDTVSWVLNAYNIMFAVCRSSRSARCCVRSRGRSAC